MIYSATGEEEIAQFEDSVKKKYSRRSFIKNSIRLFILAFLGLSFEGRDNIKVEHLKLRFSNLPYSFDDFKIVQISDLHASFWVKSDYLLKVVKQINQLEKDLLVITGDFITSSKDNLLTRWLPVKQKYISVVVDVLANLKEGKKLAVLGNHDQWDGIKIERHLVKELERIGFQVLRNRALRLTRDGESIYVIGTDDFWFSCNLSQALRNVPNNAFKILISHNPDITGDIQEDMKIDLTLCGHTHGGQVAIPYLSQHFIPIKNPARYMAGLVREPYGYTYVNRGIGTLIFPLRFGAPPEITYFTLNRLT